MTELGSGLRGRSRFLRASSDTRRSEGSQFEDGVLRHAGEIATCWRYEAGASFHGSLSSAV